MSNSSNNLEFLTLPENANEDNMTSNYEGASGAGNGNNSTIGNWMWRQSKHPLPLFFHLLFKSLALFLYIFGSWFTSNFIFTFVICIVLLAFDFWTVKNISGRLLVGLRWWTVESSEGTSEYIFEALEDHSELSGLDQRLFWWSLYASLGAWCTMLVVGLLRLKFEYMPVVMTALALSGANVYGYMQCSNYAQEKATKLRNQGRTVSTGVLEHNMVQEWVMSRVLAMAGNAVQSAAPANSV